MHNALILAVTDDSIHVDCLYFLMRRHPDVMLGMLHQRPGSTMMSSSSIHNPNNDNGRSTTANSDTAASGHRNTDHNNNDALMNDNTNNAQ